MQRGWRSGRRQDRDSIRSTRRSPATRSTRLDEIDLVVFDKDGTLISFEAMWGGWARRAGVAARDRHAPAGRGRRLHDDRLRPRRPIASSRAGRWRSRRWPAIEELVRRRAPALVPERRGRPPDPRGGVVRAGSGRPCGSARRSRRLFATLHAAGRRIAVATTDDRRPTEATLAALGLADSCRRSCAATTRVPTKPDPEALVELAARAGARSSHGDGRRHAGRPPDGAAGRRRPGDRGGQRRRVRGRPGGGCRPRARRRRRPDHAAALTATRRLVRIGRRYLWAIAREGAPSVPVRRGDFQAAVPSPHPDVARGGPAPPDGRRLRATRPRLASTRRLDPRRPAARPGTLGAASSPSVRPDRVPPVRTRSPAATPCAASPSEGQRPARPRDPLRGRRRRRDGRSSRSPGSASGCTTPARATRSARRPARPVATRSSTGSRSLARRRAGRRAQAIRTGEVVTLRDTLVDTPTDGRPRHVRAERHPERLLRPDRSSATSRSACSSSTTTRSTTGPPRRRPSPAASPTRWRRPSATPGSTTRSSSLAARLEAVQELAIRLNRTRDLAEIAAVIVEGTERLIDARLDPRLPASTTRPACASRSRSRGTFGGSPTRTRPSLRVPIGEGLTGWAAAHNETVLVGDAAADPRALARLPRPTARSRSLPCRSASRTTSTA